MDWARDQLGKPVHASDRILFSYGFTCPTCGERVRRRAGTERRPHFAHYSNSAKPDCEDYHPSVGEAIAISNRVWEEAQRRPAKLEALSARGGIFLERSEAGHFSLYLKLPRLKPDADVAGEVQIQSGLGVRTYSASQLRKPQFVPTLPRVPLVRVVATEQLAGASAAIEDDISIFRSTGNVFSAGNEGGRLLAPEEPLEWGESYRIFTQYALLPAPGELQCALLARGGAQGWLLYEIHLPTPSVGEEALKLGAISRYLGRAIKRGRPRVYLIEPPPHHIDPDGTYVFPSILQRVLLRRTAECDVSIESETGTEETHTEDRGEWIEISNLEKGEFAILVDARPHVSMRIDDCKLFRPQGVQVTVGDSAWEIFDTNLRDELREKLFEAATIQCPSPRIADSVQLNRELWSERGGYYFPRSPLTRLDIDAQNFGALVWPSMVLPDDLPESVKDENVEARKRWVEGLVTRIAGKRASLYLENQTLLSRDFPWLYPYVQKT